MRNTIILSALTALLLAACNGPSQKEEGEADANKIENEETADSVLLQNSVKVQFDDIGEDDTFMIKVIGTDTLNASVEFSITSDKGEVIYKDVFASNMLAATYNENIVSKTQQIDLIKKRVRTFFDDASFKIPAINKDMPHDPQFLDMATYNELKEGKMKGFVYVIGKENAKYIAWSPLKGEVLMYFNCC